MAEPTCGADQEMRVAVVTGTRPQIVKTAPVLQATTENDIDVVFIHTGQHYDYEMATQFIEELSIPSPDFNLGVGSFSSPVQTSRIIERLVPVLEETRPDCMLVPGDTNSALAAALTGFKMDIPTAHLESGLRSYDMYMQEEINRRLIDHGSSALFAPTTTAVNNLRRENVRGDVYHVGDTMYDVLKDKLEVFSSDEFYESMRRAARLDVDEFAVLTLHRRENVDDPWRFRSILSGLSRLEFKIVFPVHPRTRKKLTETGLRLGDNVLVVRPFPYTHMMALVSRAQLLVTDSGGLQKEAYLLNTPCVTVRDNTEWVETLRAGANVLSRADASDIVAKCSMMWGKELSNDPSVYGDGQASRRIAKILASDDISIPRFSMV